MRLNWKLPFASECGFGCRYGRRGVELADDLFAWLNYLSVPAEPRRKIFEGGALAQYEHLSERLEP